MSGIPSRTLIFLGIVVTNVIAWEIYTLFSPAPVITSEVARFNCGHPWVGASMGILLGHFFFNRKPTAAEYRKWYGQEPPC